MRAFGEKYGEPYLVGKKLRFRGPRLPSAFAGSRKRFIDRIRCARANSRWQDWNINAKTIRRILRAYEEEDDWVLIGGVDGNGDDARVAIGARLKRNSTNCIRHGYS